ncbi:uncharacterized protein N7496_008019 [Penicillium cataractarum]|uniref:penicillopepsin n=1 Tax=Penicillium cataractarum TaxID=2100454 RepID=A0A9W9V5C1_9EURO|nr:uncharacterized protein N7496_008019 [Penicillium cataractarum]KAJ5368259.1 hypothetical protein N7496_008019 [Penicillium cataractarum]
MRVLPLCTIAAGSIALSRANGSPLNRRDSSTTIPLVATQFGTVFDVPVTIGNQTFQLLVDTGSSDTYVMNTGFTCINGTSNLVIPQADCLYSNKTYHTSSTYRPVQNEMFGIQYGAGLASGILAYEDVKVGGIAVQSQKIGIANISNPMGDGVNSGLLGLAYPSITSAHPANHTSNETYWFDRLPYNPLLYTMHKKGIVEPYFSLALAHTPQNESTAFGGYLTLGGLPPVNHSEFTTVPVEFTKNIPLNYTSGKRARTYWSTTLTGGIYGSSMNNLTTNLTPFQAFIDSGNYISFLPSAIVDSVNSLFSPPATYDAASGMYIVDCSAKAPQFGLIINNATFWHNGEDLIYQTSEGVCVSSLASSESVSIGGLTLNIIGVPFLKNVVAVFDFGNNEMRFAKLLEFGDGGLGGVGAGNGSVSSTSAGSSMLSTSTPWIGFGMALFASMVLSS